MIVVVADTSGLLAALDEDHSAGPAAREVLDRSGLLVVSPVLLSELDHLARRILGFDAAVDAVNDILHRVRSGRAVMPEITAEILEAAQAVRARHLGLRLDIADAVNIALAAQFRTDAILTLDQRDFRAVRPLTAEHKAFRVLPFDL
ncbi:PIN domain-containing protein [Kitasatospora sp. NPDC094019]|uniref:PIN domain-containing protein n=1 Tax=Streptomycetaceae TaxID=2062 RepID=UPI00087A3537|nr:PIN domain-containing protein [Streptomyces sp. TLI_053]SDT31554.1 Predicted nucleic acid-binding protein, contains PIN domain [Streptomyces sp. TLI_053]